MADNLGVIGKVGFIFSCRSTPLLPIGTINVNEQTREAVENPIDKVRRLNEVVGLANHTTLISKSGQEFAIGDSGSPIRDANGKMGGIVLVFRDVTQQRSLEAAMRSNERLAMAGRLSASIAHEIHNPIDTANNLLFLAEQISDRSQVQKLVLSAMGEVLRVAPQLNRLTCSPGIPCDPRRFGRTLSIFPLASME